MSYKHRRHYHHHYQQCMCLEVNFFKLLNYLQRNVEEMLAVWEVKSVWRPRKRRLLMELRILARNG